MILIQRDLKENQSKALRTGVRGEAEVRQPCVQKAVEDVGGGSVRGFLKSYIVCVCVCDMCGKMCARIHGPQHPYEGQGTTFRSWGSPLGSRMELILSHLCASNWFLLESSC